MSSRDTMAQTVEFYHQAFAESRQYLGVDAGDEADNFHQLLEAAWDMGIIGETEEDLKEALGDYGFDFNTQRGFDIHYIARSMLERSIQVHSVKSAEAIK